MPLSSLRMVFKILNLDLSNFGIECPACASDHVAISMLALPRHTLIAQRRALKGLTPEALGDVIGFETAAIEEMEQNPDWLERWPIQPIRDLADALSLPLATLLHMPCPRCGTGGLR